MASYGLPAITTRGNNVYGPRQFPEKLKLKALGWSERTPWEEGIKKTAEWYVEHGAEWWGDVDVSATLLPHPRMLTPQQSFDTTPRQCAIYAVASALPHTWHRCRCRHHLHLRTHPELPPPSRRAFSSIVFPSTRLIRLPPARGGVATLVAVDRLYQAPR
uniref:Uncharacterized protein n=1 Tax=Oryza nivara TaxID=4536 RepID=A0A0E0HAW4_ORYNI